MFSFRFMGVVISSMMTILLLVACGSDELSPTLTPEQVIMVVTATPDTDDATSDPDNNSELDLSQRSTLAPSWTPTATSTPTATPTITYTPTVTLTPSISSICENFSVSFFLIDNFAYTSTDYANILVDTGGPTISAILQFINTDNDGDVSITLPGDGPYLVDIPLDFEPGPGDYMWVVKASSPIYEEICQTSGTFTIRARSPLEVMYDTLDDIRSSPVETSTPQAEATDEPTP